MARRLAISRYRGKDFSRARVVGDQSANQVSAVVPGKNILAGTRRPPRHQTVTHLVGHLMREVESATRQVLMGLPAATACFQKNASKGKKPEAEINAVIHELGLENDGLVAHWHSFSGQDGLHGTAHRRDLQHPRAIDDDFLSRLDLLVSVLARVLDAAGAKITLKCYRF